MDKFPAAEFFLHRRASVFYFWEVPYVDLCEFRERLKYALCLLGCPGGLGVGAFDVLGEDCCPFSVFEVCDVVWGGRVGWEVLEDGAFAQV